MWALHPDTLTTSMKSVGFINVGTHFVGISDRTVVVGSLDIIYENTPFHSPLGSSREKAIFLDVPAEGAPVMEAWGNYGNHVFTCDDRVYVCVMLRSLSDANVVGATIYSLDGLPGGEFALVRTYDIGAFAVYLGANQALVLPAAGSMNQLANTIYIPDDDGVIYTERVWAVNIASGETHAIPFPAGLLVGDYGRAAWAAPPPLNMPFWHCDTKMGF